MQVKRRMGRGRRRVRFLANAVIGSLRHMALCAEVERDVRMCFQMRFFLNDC